MEGFATSPWLFSCLLVTVSWVSGHIGLLWLLSIVIVYLFQASFYTSCHIPKSWLQGWQNWREKEHFVSSPYLDLAATWLLFTSLRNSGTIMIRQFVWTRISGMGEATLHFSLNLLQEIFPRESFRLKSALFFQTNSVSQLKFRYFDREFSFCLAVIHLISWWNRNNNIFKKKQNLTITVMKKEFRSWQLWASSMSNSLELSSCLGIICSTYTVSWYNIYTRPRILISERLSSLLWISTNRSIEISTKW